jgi:hypothetical protein
MTPMGFEPPVSAGKLNVEHSNVVTKPQIYALDGATAGTDQDSH